MKKTTLLAFAGYLAAVSPAPADSLLQTRDWVPDGYRNLLNALPDPAPYRKPTPGGLLTHEGTPRSIGAGAPGNRLGIRRGMGENVGTGWDPAHDGFRRTGALLDKGCKPGGRDEWKCN